MILVYSKILESLRNKVNSLNIDLISYMIKCTMCMGFWVGIWNWIFLPLSFNWFMAGCISSGTSYFISRLVDDDGIMIKVKK